MMTFQSTTQSNRHIQTVRTTRRPVGFFVGIPTSLAVLWLIVAPAAAVPGSVPYVGELTLVDGTPVDATVDLEVSLFATATGDSPLWGPFNYPGTVVDVGVFSILLGDLDTAPIDDALLASDAVWVEFVLNGVVLQPRTRLYSVPYARLAGDTVSLGGIDAADYVQLADVGAVALSNDYNDLDNLPTLLQGPEGPAGPEGPPGPPGPAGADGIQDVNTGSGLTGGPLQTGSTIAVAQGGITSAHIADNTTTVDVQDQKGTSMFSVTDGDAALRMVGTGGTTVTFNGAQHQVTISSAADITAVVAGPGLTGGADSGSATLSLAAPTATTMGGIKATQCGGTTKVSGIDTNGAIICSADQNAGGTVTGVTASGVLTSTGGTAPNISLTGVVPAANGGTGLSSSGTSGNFLRSNGTTWSSAAISASDLPSNSTAYIQNQTAATQSAGFKLSGDGSLGGNLTVSGGTLAMNNTSTSNTLTLGSVGAAPPSQTSVGWKIKTWSSVYGIGIDASTQWYLSDSYHRFYTVSGTTYTQRMELDENGKLSVSGATQPSVGNSASNGIYFPSNPGGGSGDEAYLRYYVTSGDNTRLVMGIENDADDELVFRVDGTDRIVFHSDEIRLGAKLVQTTCPSGFALYNSGTGGGVCTEYLSTWGAQTWTAAQETCALLGARICTYADVLLGFTPGTACHGITRNGDWLGDFIGDDTVLVVNDYCNKNNFEGSADKGGSRQFVCCIDPRR